MKRHLRRFQEVAIVSLAIVIGFFLTIYVFRPWIDPEIPMNSTIIFEGRNVYPAELLEVLDRNRAFTFVKQDTQPFGVGAWPANSQMLMNNNRAGDWVDLGIPLVAPGKYEVFLYLTKSYDYGVAQFEVNAKPSVLEINLNSGGPIVPTGAVSIGIFELNGNGDKLRIKVADNKLVKGTYLGISGLILEARQ